VIGCINTYTVDCDDGDDSTQDYCDNSAGCLHKPIGEGDESEGY
jgi:hypothetical protein